MPRLRTFLLPLLLSNHPLPHLTPTLLPQRTMSKPTAQRREEHFIKACAACGRGIYRKSASDDMISEIKYCSASCRRNKPTALDRQLERSILEQLGKARAENRGSLTDDEVRVQFSGREWPALQHEWRQKNSKASGGEDEAGEANRPPPAATAKDTVENAEAVNLGAGDDASTTTEPARLRERTRQAARRLCNDGKVLIMQKKKPVDPSFAKGTFDIVLPDTG